MNRDILFRGWSINDGKWVFGSHAYIKNVEGRICHAILNLKDYVTELNIFDDIDPDSIGEATNFLDVNNQTVFEGDIIEGEGGGNKMEVIHHENSFVGKYVMPSGRVYYVDLTGTFRARIVGNVYEQKKK